MTTGLDNESIEIQLGRIRACVDDGLLMEMIETYGRDKYNEGYDDALEPEEFNEATQIRY